MPSVEVIIQSIQQRLEELGEETDRLGAAMKALGDDNRDIERTRGKRRPTRSVLQQALTNRRTRPAGDNNEQEPVKAKRGYVILPSANGNAGDGDDRAPATPRDRALSQLRRELAAGLRNT